MAEATQTSREPKGSRSTPRSAGNARDRESETAPIPGNAVSGERESRLERISRRAHEIYEARGGAHGRDLDDWLRAEREIDSEIDGEPA